MTKQEYLQQSLETILTNSILDINISKLNEVTLTIDPDNLVQVMTLLKNHEDLHFEQCIDLSCVDYLTYRNDYSGLRFAIVYHLLSIKYNWRLRVKTYLKDNDNPRVESVNLLWNSVNWFEREAFDMFGIVFDNHPDLRRIITDYGFVGHPFRKDFPLTGYVEMKYDQEQKRVIYQDVTIEPREITPKIIREDNYCGRN
jgi:NADH-quinone oxidoreductase subunit C